MEEQLTLKIDPDPENVPEKEFDIFISYEWITQDIAIKLRDHLRNLGFQCWMDIENVAGGDELHGKIVEGLTRCKVMVACITKKYTASKNCKREISFADKKSKPIIPLLLDDAEWPPNSSTGFVLTDIVYIDFKTCRQQLLEWSGPKVDELLKQLRKYLSDISSPHEFPISPTPPSTLQVTPPLQGQALKVLYNRDDFSPVEGRSEIQERGRYPGRSAYFIDCRITDLAGGWNSFEEIRDALNPLFQGNIGTITQLRGTVQGAGVAEVSPHRDEETTLYCSAEGEGHSRREMAESNQEQVISSGGRIFISGGGRRTVLKISRRSWWDFFAIPFRWIFR